jgi:hypothetical protein
MVRDGWEYVARSAAIDRPYSGDHMMTLDQNRDPDSCLLWCRWIALPPTGRHGAVARNKNHVSSIEKVSRRLGLKYQEQNKENYLLPYYLQ